MERKTARISKEPGVRRQGILNTAMSVFVEKGYEAATIRDIAAAMYVVPGLYYRCYELEQVLYDTVIEQYIKGTTYPMTELLKETEHSLDGFLGRMEQLFTQTDGEEKYRHFFHRKENHNPQMLIPVKLCETIEPYMEEKLQMMNEKGVTRVKSISITTSYILFGTIPVLENDELSVAEKISGIRMITKCILDLQPS